MTIGFGWGRKPLKMWRSEPQMAVEVTRRIASVGSFRTGSGTWSTEIFLGWWNTAARMENSSGLRPPQQVPRPPDRGLRGPPDGAQLVRACDPPPRGGRPTGRVAAPRSCRDWAVRRDSRYLRVM